jgi:hypothetical protein
MPKQIMSGPLLPLFMLFTISCASTGRHQDARIAPNAPQDRPVHFAGDPDAASARWRALAAPHVEKAMASYPAAKSRYLAGLPAGETFLVTTLLRDEQGHFESAFVVVERIADRQVTGQIATQLDLVRGYRNGQTISFPESEVLDWTITKPDGSEEGNFVGKFLDTQSQRQ